MSKIQNFQKDKNFLKYGINPDHEAFITGKSSETFIKPLTKYADFSATNLLDIELGYKFIKSYKKGISLVKHNLPVNIIANETNTTIADLYKEILRWNKGITHGTLVIKGTIDLEIAKLITQNYYHSIAAKNFTKDAIEYLSASDIVQKMRGLVLSQVDFDRRININKRSTILCRLGLHNCLVDVQKPHAMRRMNFKYLSSKHSFSDLVFGYKIMSNIRTISVIIINGLHLLCKSVAQQDSVEALEQAISIYRKHKNLDVKKENVMLLTDGCFGVNDPLKIIRKNGFKNLVIFGNKDNDEQLWRRSKDMEINLSIYNKRLFNH